MVNRSYCFQVSWTENLKTLKECCKTEIFSSPGQFHSHRLSLIIISLPLRPHLCRRQPQAFQTVRDVTCSTWSSSLQLVSFADEVFDQLWVHCWRSVCSQLMWEWAAAVWAAGNTAPAFSVVGRISCGASLVESPCDGCLLATRQSLHNQAVLDLHRYTAHQWFFDAVYYIFTAD